MEFPKKPEISAKDAESTFWLTRGASCLRRTEGESRRETSLHLAVALSHIYHWPFFLCLCLCPVSCVVGMKEAKNVLREGCISTSQRRVARRPG